MKRAVIVLFGMLIVLLVVLGTFAWYSDWSVRAGPSEQVRDLSGDELIPKPVGSVNHAVTIRGPPHDVWPWLAQMESGRAGWYAYDFIDNAGRPSAERILPEFQDVGVGAVFPALPGAKDVFVVVRCEPEHSLVLAWRSPNGTYLTTWAFVLEQPEPNRTRLIVRGRVAPGYDPAAMARQTDGSTGACHYGAQTVARNPAARRSHSVAFRKMNEGSLQRMLDVAVRKRLRESQVHSMR